MTPSSPLLHVKGLTVAFGGQPVLAAVDLTVPRGGFVGLVGPNGAGKTTLLNAVSGLVSARSGAVLHEGSDLLPRASHARARRGIGRTFQQAELLDDLTCVENVLLGGFAANPWFGWFRRPTLESARVRALETLDEVGLHDAAESTVASLPFGMRRRVDLARALVTRPNLLLLDEPLSGLSSTEREAMVRLLAELPDQGMSVLMIEHDVENVRRLCAQVVVLDYGVTLANGGPEVLDLPEVQEAYMGVAKEDA